MSEESFKTQWYLIADEHKKHWHYAFGSLLYYLLTPVNIEVGIEVPVMKEPPRADILLIRRATAQWTLEQLALLPDGIRDATAHYIMLEFKYTQSISLNGILQAINNQRLYLQTHKEIKPDDFKSFLISAREPQTETLEKYEFYEIHQGVYESKNNVIAPISLISINRLADTEYNAWIRCFASKKKHQKEAFAQLSRILHNFDKELHWIIAGLRIMLFGREEMDSSELPYTLEEIMRLGKIWEESYLANMTVEERLKGLDAETVLKHYGREEFLQGLAPEERLRGLAPEERLKGLDAKTVLQQYEPVERLQGLSPEQIEAYLQKIKKH